MIRTGSGFGAQIAIERKIPNGNTEVMDWFQLGFRRSGNFAREWIGNVAMTVGTDVNVPRTRRSETFISHPFGPLLPTFAFCFMLSSFHSALRLESERMVRVGA